MTCVEVQQLLSAHIDYELDHETREKVEAHLSFCDRCAQERASFEDLSRLAGFLTPSKPPEQVWSKIEDTLIVEQPGKRGGRFSRRALALTVAALVLLTIGISLVAYTLLNQHASHREMDLARYVDRFHNDPVQAQQVLIQRWNGLTSTPVKAMQDLSYQPVVSALPEGYRLKSFCLLNMPCCRCPQAILERADGSSLAVFEYEGDHPAWLGDRAHIQAVCANCPTTLVQTGNHLAVTWKVRGRFVTIVGARDVDEVSRLVAAFNPLA